jgi:hypothetical protein
MIKDETNRDKVVSAVTPHVIRIAKALGAQYQELCEDEVRFHYMGCEVTLRVKEIAKRPLIQGKSALTETDLTP